MKRRSPASEKTQNRRGAVMVESAVVISVVLLILFALLDLGLATLNSNNLKDAAQQVTRAAMVRGSGASAISDVWGPATYSGTAAAGDEIAMQAAATLINIPKDKVNITVEWLDGGCDDGNRVRATLTYQHLLIAPQLFGYSSVKLTAVSTVRIVN